MAISLFSCSALQGARGDKGDPGDKGDSGDKGDKGDQGNSGENGVGILKAEIIDGYLWITYTNDPNNPVNVGKVTGDDNQDQDVEIGEDEYRILQNVAEVYRTSAPTKVSAITKQTFTSYELNSNYELKVGTIENNVMASVYTFTKEELESIENAGGTDIVRPMIRVTSGMVESIDGIGYRVNGGDWSTGDSPYFIDSGAMALTFDKTSVANVVCHDSVVTFNVRKDKVDNVFGEGVLSGGIDGDIQVVIVIDGSVIRSITLAYTVAGDSAAHLAPSEMIIYVEYSYEKQSITIT